MSGFGGNEAGAREAIHDRVTGELVGARREVIRAGEVVLESARTRRFERVGGIDISITAGANALNALNAAFVAKAKGQGDLSPENVRVFNLVRTLLALNTQADRKPSSTSPDRFAAAT